MQIGRALFEFLLSQSSRWQTTVLCLTSTYLLFRQNNGVVLFIKVIEGVLLLVNHVVLEIWKVSLGLSIFCFVAVNDQCKRHSGPRAITIE